jgi:radical SAM superfamily enzyme YgiQ (UPF0313 family)
MDAMRVRLLSLDSFYDNSLALDYISAYASTRPALTVKGVEFRTLICRGDTSRSKFREEFYSNSSDVVGFNTYVWNIEATLNAVRDIKRRHPDTTVILGGMEAAYTAQPLLSAVPEIDFVVIGEGEITFADLLERLLHGTRVEGRIPGLAYRDVYGNVISGGAGPIVQRLDDIPSPFRSPKFQDRKLNDVLYESYRGCAFHCGFCLYHRDYTKQRYFSSDRVANDIRALRDAGCSHIRFVDSTFNIHRPRVKEILSYLDGIDADVSVEVSAEFFDTETIDMLSRAGIRHVDIGLQSTNRGALATVNREWYREDLFEKNLLYLRDHPALTLNVELIAGLPSDDFESLKRSIDEAVSLWPDHISVYRLLGLKGTEVERQKEKLGLRFSERPPYELIESASFPKEVLDEVELLTFSHLVMFNLGIARYAFKHILGITRKRPTELYEEFWRFVIKENLYDRQEALLLSRFYAYGNRFDRDLPNGLEPLRVKKAIEAFFVKASIDNGNEIQNTLTKELMDYGYRLALLDLEEKSARAMKPPDNSEQLRMAPWCSKVRYSQALYDELLRQGDEVAGMKPEQISSIVFFVHPEFGPASLAIDEATNELLSTFEGHTSDSYLRSVNDDTKDHTDGLAISEDAKEAIAQLKALRILTTNLKPLPLNLGGSNSVLPLS